MTRSIVHKLVLTLAVLVAGFWLAPEADAGVANKSYGVKVTRSGETFDDCFFFAGGNKFTSSVGLAGNWTEFDLFFFGWWSFNASNNVRFSGFQVFGLWIFGSGQSFTGEPFFASGFQGCFFSSPGELARLQNRTAQRLMREFDPRVWR